MMASGLAVGALFSSFLDGLAAALFLFFSKRTRAGGKVDSGRILLAALAMGISFLFKLPVWRTLGLNAFGAMRLVYLDAVAALPLLGVSLLLANATGRLCLTRVAAAIAWGCFLLAGVGVYATLIEPFRLVVERASLDLPEERIGSEPIRIAVLSDLQTDAIGAYERSAARLLMAGNPDLILIPGDLFQGSPADFERQLPALHDLLKGLEASGGVFLVPGDVDPPIDQLRRAISGTSVRLLVNETATTTVGDRRVLLGGITTSFTSAAAASVVRKLQDQDHQTVCLLLSHRPDVVLGLAAVSRKIDLIVAGHTHGGQVVVPGFGPLLTLSRVPRDVAAGGLHRVQGQPIYVSRGVGHERGQAPRLRFFCPPEISEIELR